MTAGSRVTIRKQSVHLISYASDIHPTHVHPGFNTMVTMMTMQRHRDTSTLGSSTSLTWPVWYVKEVNSQIVFRFLQGHLTDKQMEKKIFCAGRSTSGIDPSPDHTTTLSGSKWTHTESWPCVSGSSFVTPDGTGPILYIRFFRPDIIQSWKEVGSEEVDLIGI